MLLTITSNSEPASDLGFILHKHPDKVQEFSLPFGHAHVFYPISTNAQSTCALLVEIDPVALVKRRRSGLLLTDYVNDRPYVASSFMSVALARVFGSALKGQLADRSERATKPMALEARIAVVSSYDGEGAIRRLFEPLGYEVTAIGHPLGSWGESTYFTLTLKGTLPVKDLLEHLYVLLPVLDGAKHYWIDESEIDKLLRAGEAWLSGHPERDVIVRRYLKGQRTLADQARDRLLAEDVGLSNALEIEEQNGLVAQPPLQRLRISTVAEQLKRRGARRILDLGCGEGQLIDELLRDPAVAYVAGMDVSVSALAKATRRLKLEEMSHRQRARVSLFQGSLTYRDRRLKGFDAAALIEVIEHLDPWRMDSFEWNVFGDARSGTVVVTTPNAEYNVAFGGLPEGSLRHVDHRFEMSRMEFADWAHKVASRHGYSVELSGIGAEQRGIGSPTQMGVFQIDPNLSEA